MAKRTLQGKQLPITAKDLDKSRWIKTPLVYARQGATLNRMQTDVMLMVSEKLQSFINGFFADGRNKLGVAPNSAVPDDAFVDPDKMLPIRINLDEITDKYHYERLDSALKDMSNLEIRVSMRTQKKNDQGALLFDINGNPIMHDVFNIMPLFSVITVPKFENDSQKRKGYIDLKINKEVANTVFDMNHGFVEHLARIAKYSQTDATSKVYLLLKAKMYQQHKNKVVVPTVELKTATGHILYDPKTGLMLSETYLKWSEYVRRILVPVQKDLDKMSLDNKTEFSFTFLPLYKGGKSRGTPENVEFTIVPSQLGLAHKRTKGMSTFAVEQDLFATNPESKREQERRDWLQLLHEYKPKNELARVLNDCRFVGAVNVRDKSGIARHIFSIALTDEQRAVVNEASNGNDYERFLKKITVVFGSEYYPALYIVKA